MTLLADGQPVAASSQASTQSSVCSFLAVTEGQDDLDVVDAINKLVSDHEVKVLSFLLFGLHVAATHHWCALKPLTFQRTATLDEATLLRLINASPNDFSAVTAPLPRPVVGTPLVVIPPYTTSTNEFDGTVDVDLDWTVSGGFQNVWEEACFNQTCEPPLPYHNPEMNFVQSAVVAVPLNQKDQIYLQPDFGSTPSASRWVGTVPFEVRSDLDGTFTLVIE